MVPSPRAPAAARTGSLANAGFRETAGGVEHVRARGVARGQRVARADRRGNRRVFLTHLSREVFAACLVAARDGHACFEILIEERERLQEIRIAGGLGDR